MAFIVFDYGTVGRLRFGYLSVFAQVEDELFWLGPCFLFSFVDAMSNNADGGANAYQ